MRKNAINYLLENSGEFFAIAAFFSCAMSTLGLFLIGKLEIQWFPINQKIISKIIYFDLYVLAVAIVIFIAITEIINIDSYRNRKGIRDMGYALSSFLRENDSIFHNVLMVVAWASQLVVCISIGFGTGVGVVYNMQKVMQ